MPPGAALTFGPVRSRSGQGVAVHGADHRVARGHRHDLPNAVEHGLEATDVVNRDGCSSRAQGGADAGVANHVGVKQRVGGQRIQGACSLLAEDNGVLWALLVDPPVMGKPLSKFPFTVGASGVVTTGSNPARVLVSVSPIRAGKGSRSAIWRKPYSRATPLMTARNQEELSASVPSRSKRSASG